MVNVLLAVGHHKLIEENINFMKPLLQRTITDLFMLVSKSLVLSVLENEHGYLK